MNAPASRLTHFEQLRYAQEIMQLEGQAVLALSRRLDGEFCRAIDLIFRCHGTVIVTGMGKAGLIAQKVAATLASTGTPGHFLHPAEAVHGDLGRIHRTDVVLILSQSGETEEIVRMLPSIVALEVPIIAMTSSPASSLGRTASVTIDMGPLQEACTLGLAPSTSTTAMLAMGDALALVTSRLRDFRREDFARFHPAGALGRKLSKVEDHMRPLGVCRVAPASQTVREVLVHSRTSGRRTGAIMVVDADGTLQGIFTDSDLARLFEIRRDAALDQPIREVMTTSPTCVPRGSMMVDAVAVMAERKISELPVVDAQRQPIGLIDVTDVVGLFPEPQVAETIVQQPPLGHNGPPRPKHPLLNPAALKKATPAE